MKQIVLGLLMVLLGGCASPQLTLNLDLYDDEPAFSVPLTPAKIATLYTALDQADREAEEWTRDRSAFAQELFKTYRAVSYFNVVMRTGAKSWNETSIAGTKQRLETHATAIAQKAKDV